MSKISLSLRLRGNLPPTDELSYLLNANPTIAIRQGEPVSSRRTQPIDVWILDLFEMEDSEVESVEDQMHRAASELQRMAPMLASLERSTYEAELYLSTVRWEDQGGFALPVELITAASDAKLAIEVSITVVLDEPEDIE